MHKILAVVRREYLASVQTKMFWIGTLALPLFFVVIIGLQFASQFIDPESQKTLALIDELKAYREILAKYQERRLFPTRTLYIMDMAIAAAEGRGDDALEAYAYAYIEGFRFRSPEGEPLLTPWREKPRFLELQAMYDDDVARMRRNVREQLTNREQR